MTRRECLLLSPTFVLAIAAGGVLTGTLLVAGAWWPSDDDK